jgi:hypothetical protein
MPRVPECEGATDGCLPSCELAPLSVGFAEATASWGDASNAGDSLLAPPVVIQLDDDDCDGVVTFRDTPDIVFVTASASGDGTHGRLVSLTTEAGELVEKWSVPATAPLNDPFAQLAAGRHAGQAYVLACTEDDRLRAYDETGAERWSSEPLAACDAPAIGLLGAAPVAVAEGGIVSLIDGGISAAFPSPLEGPPIIADALASLPGNEIVGPATVHDASGAAVADTLRPGSFVSISDLDGDGQPEMVTVESGAGEHHLTVWRVDGTGNAVIVRAGLDTHATLPDPCLPGDPGATQSGGPPLIADLTGDGSLDVAVAGSRGIVLFDGPALATPFIEDEDTVLLEIPMADCNHGRRGLGGFDFDRDDLAELVIHDGTQVRVLSPVDGETLFSACAPGDPGYGVPPVADVDVDGSADLVAFASSLNGALCENAPAAGIAVFGHRSGTAPKWAGSPTVWTQHLDLVPTLDGDGTLTEPVSPWSTPGAVGAHATPSSEDAIDLAVGATARCPSAIDVDIRNRGAIPAPKGSAVVVVYATQSTEVGKLAAAPLPVTLDPGAAVTVEVPLGQTAWRHFSVVLEPAAGRSLYDCDVTNDAVTASCLDP